MEDLMMVALAPFYAAAIGMTYYGLAFLANQAKKMDQSATETQMTETTSPASTQQK